MQYSVKPAAKRGTRAARALAWCVHLLTAGGALWALLALRAIDADRLRDAFCWMGLALALDGLDGPLARRLRVRAVLPSIDGSLMDNLVDYLTYVLVPAYLVLSADLLPAQAELAVVGVVCVLSAFQFSHLEAKATPGSFRGFPCTWNVVAFYLVLLRPPPWVSLFVLLLLCALIFVPVLYVHPLRTRVLRGWTIFGTLAWGGALVLLGWSYPEPRPWLLWGSLLFVLYYFVLSLALTLRKPGKPRVD